MVEPNAETDGGRPKSKQLYDRALRSAPGGVQGTDLRGRRAGWDPFPIFMARGEGAYLFDVDGNRYIDYVAAMGPLILGHRPKRVIEAVSRTLAETGSLLGFGQELEVTAAEAAIQAVPCWEQMRFSNTGTEAVMLALRIARSYTGRTKVLRFEGHYHGWTDLLNFKVDENLVRSAPDSQVLSPIPSTTGMVESLADSLLMRQWNDPEVLEETFSEFGTELAAVICEPHPTSPSVPPKPGYLELLRDLTKKHGVVLIFDEVKTGFRVALGGAQELYGVLPDLSTAAKALGAGFPVAAVGGLKDLFEPFARGYVRQGSSYQANTIALAACIATLEELRQPGFYERITSLGNALTEGLSAVARQSGIAAYGRGVGSMLELVFADHRADNYRDFIRSNDTTKFPVFWKGMLDAGVMFTPRGGHWFVSGAHSEDDIARTLDLAGEVFMTMASESKSRTSAKGVGA